MMLTSAVLTSLVTLSAALKLPAQQPLSSPHLRPVTQADLDDLTNVAIDAFAPSAATRYLTIDQKKFNNYTRTCMRQQVQYMFDHKPDTIHVNVIAVPVKSGGERVVSFGFWKTLVPGQSPLLASNVASEGLSFASMALSCAKHHDINMTRWADYERQGNAAIEKHIQQSETTQLYLELLATHPDSDGHGFGAAHMAWGVSQAAARDMPVTLIATPAGYPLYKSVGFESKANVTIKMLDGLGDLWMEFMRWDSS